MPLASSAATFPDAVAAFTAAAATSSSVPTASVIMFGVLYLTHGFSAQTSSAVLGTVLSLALIGVLGTAFSAATRLTGLDDDTAKLIGVLGHGIEAVVDQFLEAPRRPFQ